MGTVTSHITLLSFSEPAVRAVGTGAALEACEVGLLISQSPF